MLQNAYQPSSSYHFEPIRTDVHSNAKQLVSGDADVSAGYKLISHWEDKEAVAVHHTEYSGPETQAIIPAAVVEPVNNRISGYPVGHMDDYDQDALPDQIVPHSEDSHAPHAPGMHEHVPGAPYPNPYRASWNIHSKQASAPDHPNMEESMFKRQPYNMPDSSFQMGKK